MKLQEKIQKVIDFKKNYQITDDEFNWLEFAQDYANHYYTEQLILSGVSQCNELLAFEDWVNKNTTTALNEGIKLALENYKKANCG
jgi:hypothetical protein